MIDWRALRGGLLVVLLTFLVIEVLSRPGPGSVAGLDARRPRTWQDWWRRGCELEEAGRDEAALEAYEAAMDLHAPDVELYRRAAELAGSFGLFDEARTNAELGLYLAPEDRACRLLVARAHVSLGAPARARRYLAALGRRELPPPFEVDRDHALLGLLRYRTDSEYFVIRTDISKATTETIARHADIIFTRYRELLPGMAEPRGAIRIFVFNLKQDYTRMIERYEQDHAESEGLTIMDEGGTIRVISCIEAGAEVFGRVPRGTRWIDRVLLHELNHVAMMLYTRGRRLPLWLSEGWAEYTAGAEPRGPGFAVGQILRLRADVIRERERRGLPFPRLESLLEGWEWKAEGFYAYAWSFVHFLRHGQRGRYRERFDAMMGHVRREPLRAFDRAFEGVDRATLERQWKRYALGL